jgi:hypothetical protein
MPKASAREFHQQQKVVLYRKALRAVSNRSGGLAPTASGANSVASALGSRPRRDPGTAVRTYHGVPQRTLQTGTFYLAENRNFLFGSDTRAQDTQSTGFAPERC